MTEQTPADKDKEKPPPDDRALAALKRLARPQPKPFDAPPPPEPEMTLGSGSATGFVGTLSKQHADESRAGDALPNMPKAPLDPADRIHMAREVRARPASPLAEVAAKSAAPVPPVSPAEPAPSKYRVLAPVMIIMAVALLVIGAWAVGALIYMQSFKPISPREVTYPLIAWNIDVKAVGGAYTRTSVVMAWSMLLCLPVGTFLLFMGMSLRKPPRPADP